MFTIKILWIAIGRVLAGFLRKLARKRVRAAERRHLQEALGRLPEPTHSVYLLSARDGLSYDEIAERLGITVAAVERELARALVALDRHYGAIDVARAVASDRPPG